ncbi:MAG: PKD domain-containing protein [Ilumatobacteraceae bacterium]
MIRKRLLLALSALAITGLVAAEGVTAGAASRASTTALGRWGGQQAIERLGTRLPSVAAANHLRTAELRQHLLEDPTLFVDERDTLLYVEPALVGAAVTTDSPFDGGIPTANAFLLNSNPSSTHTLFIDFDGELMTGNAWAASSGGDCYAEPFDSDGSPSTFNDAERNIIISVWKRMAEDYAMFDVNVTTQDPGYAAINRSSSGDNVYGTRALITKSSALCPNGKTLYANACGSCGGVAYVGVYGTTGTTHDYYQPALVFQNGVGANAKYIAEAASHEVGHNIGLSHDGTSSVGYYQGHGSWAPIMGVGYYEAIVQWSKGEYSGANNTQDDFAVAGSNGLPLRTDDHGNAAGTATALQGSPATVDGIIGGRTDVDAFTISASAGAATFSVIPAPTSPDLDVKLELRDSNGTLVASDDPASGSTGYDSPTGMGASITTTLAAGTYTLLVDGVGYGDPLNTGYSDYASLGFYRLTATVVGPDGQAPTAVAAASATSGELPFVVDFDGSGSSDPEGATLTYAWAFGTGDTSTSMSPSYTYTNAGTYSVTLTVTDDKGLSNTASLTIVVTAPVRKLDVSAISSTGTKTKTGLTVTATVTIKDDSNANVSGATVTGTWYNGGKASGSKSAVTNSSGVATITSGNLKVRTGTQIRFCVTNVTLTGGTWLTSVFAPTTATDCTTYIAP